MSTAFGMRAYDDGVELVVAGPWTPGMATAFESGRANRLVLDYALGFNEPTLDFLAGLPIRQLVVLDRRLTNLDPIYALGSTLESLAITTDPSLMLDLELVSQ